MIEISDSEDSTPPPPRVKAEVKAEVKEEPVYEIIEVQEDVKVEPVSLVTSERTMDL